MRATTLTYGNDYQYASSRLKDSVVMCDGKPIYVQEISGKGLVTATNLSNGKMETFLLDDIDLTPIQLGYINSKDRACFGYRYPSRTYKQGLTKYNFGAHNFYETYHSKSVVRTILNIYPSLEDCLEQAINHEIDSIAFSRDFAVGFAEEDLKCPLFYRDVRVGYISWNNKGNNCNYELHNRFEFLQEVLEKAIKNV